MNDLQKIRLRQDGKVTVARLDDCKQFYVWSDCHFFDNSIIEFSNRPYWFSSSITKTLIPDYMSMNADIAQKLLDIPNNSFILNLGDFVHLESLNAENYVKNLNESLHKKGCKLGIVLGNHDFLTDASKLSYSAWSGREEEFYKKMGFDYVFVKPVTVLRPARGFGYEKLLFTHKPVKDEVLQHMEIKKQYHGHTHQYKEEDIYSKLDFDMEPLASRTMNCCVDLTGPVLVRKSEKKGLGEVTFIEKDIDEGLYCTDPWLKKEE